MRTVDTAYGPVVAGDDSHALLGLGLLLGLIAFGIVAILGAYTIFDFHRLRRSSPDAAVPIAAGIFLDVVNVFLFALDLFGGERR